VPVPVTAALCDRLEGCCCIQLSYGREASDETCRARTPEVTMDLARCQMQWQRRRLADDAIDLRRHLALGHQSPAQLDLDASAVALGHVVQTVAVTVIPVIDPTVRCVCRPPTFISHRPIV
jgi:hypothetical protein